MNHIEVEKIITWLGEILPLENTAQKALNQFEIWRNFWLS
jgi:hypothetical protein